jgi:alkylation response protein AidB-like acyl-CoA dehydrogenase
MPALTEAIRQSLSAPPARREESLEDWRARLQAIAPAWPDTAARALVAGSEAACVAFAFAAGYQCALERMLGPAPGAPFRALCVTERDGNRPRDLHATLRERPSGWRLDGEKTYVTGGAQAAQLCVAARLAGSPAERPVLRMVCLPATRAGIRLAALPALAWVTELPHAAVHLDEVAVEPGEILPGDGYTDYVKPFRTLEDIHVELALLGLLVRRLRPLPGHATTIERLLAAIASLHATSTLAPLDPETHLMLAGTRAALQPLLDELATAWQEADPVFHANWQRDARLLGVARHARDARTAAAWTRIDGGKADR